MTTITKFFDEANKAEDRAKYYKAYAEAADKAYKAYAATLAEAIELKGNT